MLRSGKRVLRCLPALHPAVASQWPASRLYVLHSASHSASLAPRAYARANHSSPIGKIDKPTYQLTFTCKACSTRSSHLVSKQAYHNGTVLIQCPGCKNRHLIADHLNVFGQGKKTLEDILKAKGDGEQITKHTIDLNKVGDIEWDGPNQSPEQHLLDNNEHK